MRNRMLAGPVEQDCAIGCWGLVEQDCAIGCWGLVEQDCAIGPRRASSVITGEVTSGWHT